jgi:hypothetical protein
MFIIFQFFEVVQKSSIKKKMYDFKYNVNILKVQSFWRQEKSGKTTDILSAKNLNK